MPFSRRRDTSADSSRSARRGPLAWAKAKPAIAVACGVALAGAGSAVAVAATGTSAPTPRQIVACVDSHVPGTMYAVSSVAVCRRNGQRALIWNTAGRPGSAGKPGQKGKPGVAGAKGDTGAVGAKGDPGVKGDTGADGAEGGTGGQGSTGSTGATGPQGPSGSNGSTGPAGPSLSTGITGPTFQTLPTTGTLTVATTPSFTLTASEPHLALNAAVSISNGSGGTFVAFCQFALDGAATGQVFQELLGSTITEEIAMSFWMSASAGAHTVSIQCGSGGSPMIVAYSSGVVVATG
jgi:hypothetical protein